MISIALHQPDRLRGSANLMRDEQGQATLPCCDGVRVERPTVHDTDEKTLCYYLKAGELFELQRRSLSLMATTLLMEVAGIATGESFDLLERTVAEDLKRASDLTGGIRPPSRCAHLQDHLSKVTSLLIIARASLAETLLRGGDAAPVRRALWMATGELNLCANLLPGADLVDRSQSCCSSMAPSTAS
jgi:hypothetical protein